MTPAGDADLVDDEAPTERPSPRNRTGFALGQRRREIIRALMMMRATRFPLARPLTSEQMRERLHRQGVYLSASTVRWHIERIRDEADLEACAPGEAE